MMFPLRVVYGLLAVSVLTNVIVITRTARIDWHRFVHREQAVPAVREGEHVRGPLHARVTIIEYSDFECPFCARFHRVLKAAVAEDGDVRWVFRHLPLTEMHPMAAAAAEAAECAGRQNRFWEYADLVFDRQQDITHEQLVTIARDVNLDATRFAVCLQSGQQRERVGIDAKAFSDGHLSGTPTWFVNGTRFEGALTIEEVRRAIAAARRTLRES